MRGLPHSKKSDLKKIGHSFCCGVAMFRDSAFASVPRLHQVWAADKRENALIRCPHLACSGLPLSRHHCTALVQLRKKLIFCNNNIYTIQSTSSCIIAKDYK